MRDAQKRDVMEEKKEKEKERADIIEMSVLVRCEMSAYTVLRHAEWKKLKEKFLCLCARETRKRGNPA